MSELLGDATRDTLAQLWMKNFAKNIENGLLSDHKFSEILFPEPPPSKLKTSLKTAALVVGAGPSLVANKHLELLNDWACDDIHNRGLLTIFATDRVLVPFVKQTNIVPDYVVTVDGNSEKIARFYDDPSVKAAVSEYRPKAVLAATVSPNVVAVCKKNSLPIYWFVAMLDQFNLTNNITRLMHFMTGATAVNCGGNSGSSAWALANYLEAPEIALIGLDYGYLKGTPIEQTAYYETLKDKAADPTAIFALYFDHHNPDFNIDCYSDIMFGHYKEAFLNMLGLASLSRPSLRTVNCTEGGILHGAGLKGMKFKDWLNSLERQERPQVAA